jgi:hypothetical protein
MAAEDHTGEHSFDELARGLASGTISRRNALRLMGAALVGGALASIPGMAWAAKGGNSACAKFCRENFPPGRERGECISAGARGEGPCFDNGGGGCTTELASCLDESGGPGYCCCGDFNNCICCPAAGNRVCGIAFPSGEPVCPGI